MKKAISILSVSLVLLLSGCCKEKNSNNGGMFNNTGKYNRAVVDRTKGFPDDRMKILDQTGMSLNDFKQYSILPATELTPDRKTTIKTVRDRGIAKPATNTLIQKVIPLDDVITYMNNVYGGTVGGFVCAAGDIKALKTQTQVIEGLRLDYEGTKFKKDGAGYAVIRLPYNIMDELIIPFSREMGGSSTGDAPFTGTGFTASLLGDGGYPEYTYTDYITPARGSELYEVTPNGNEILRAQFIDGRWQTFDGVLLKSAGNRYNLRNGLFASYAGTLYEACPNEDGSFSLISDTEKEGFALNPVSGRYVKTVFADEVTLRRIETRAAWKGHDFRVTGETAGDYILTTRDPETARALSLGVLEKGIYAATVAKTEIADTIYETIR